MKDICFTVVGVIGTGSSVGACGLPDGCCGFADGFCGFPDGANGLPDGASGFPDGTNGFPDGANGLPDGCCGFADGFCGFADGFCGFPDGCCGFPDGCCGFPDGFCGFPDGCCGFPDGCCGFPDGCCGFPDGCCGSPDGCCGFADGFCGSPVGCWPPDPPSFPSTGGCDGAELSFPFPPPCLSSSFVFVDGVFLFFTVILHTSFFFATFAVMLAFPFFFAFTTPLEETVATFFLLLFHFTFFFVPFTFRRRLFPTTNVAFFLFSLIFVFFAIDCDGEENIVMTNTRQSKIDVNLLLIESILSHLFSRVCLSGTNTYNNTLSISDHLFLIFSRRHIFQVNTLYTL